jgi:hypothetical protein
VAVNHSSVNDVVIFNSMNPLRYWMYGLMWLFTGCQSIQLPQRTASKAAVTGSKFYQTASNFNWQQRDSFAVEQILSGNYPPFLRKLTPVTIQVFDSVSNTMLQAALFVTTDYLSIGNKEDWARIPLTPMAAQKIADSFHCFLPTRKIVDTIYRAARVKLEPVPLFAFRDSTPIMYHHHLMIEGQRKGQQGLIAGIKKDVVLTGKIRSSKKPDRVAIYGWHKMDGRPIQPLYTGHVNWYVDYSHGIRLVYRKIKVEGHWMDYETVLKDKRLHRLICDEEDCDFYRYAY